MVEFVRCEVDIGTWREQENKLIFFLGFIVLRIRIGEGELDKFLDGELRMFGFEIQNPKFESFLGFEIQILNAFCL